MHNVIYETKVGYNGGWVFLYNSGVVEFVSEHQIGEEYPDTFTLDPCDIDNLIEVLHQIKEIRREDTP